MSSVELLPCPFCGVVAATVGGMVPWAQCDACDASGPQRESEADAIAAWNTRACVEANTEALRAEVAEVREAWNRSRDATIRHQLNAERLAEALRNAIAAGLPDEVRMAAMDALHPTAAQENGRE